MLVQYRIKESLSEDKKKILTYNVASHMSRISDGFDIHSNENIIDVTFSSKKDEFFARLYGIPPSLSKYLENN